MIPAGGGAATLSQGGAVIVSQSAAAATGLFGLSLGATIGIGVVVGILIIAGIRYYILKNDKGSSQQSPPQIKNFQCPNLPEQPELSSFSNALSISSQQIKQYQEAYSCAISYSLMVQPVLGLCCGKRNYQKVVISAWIDKFENCPYCKKKISKKDLIQNESLKKGIKIFRKQLAKRTKKMAEQRIQEDGLNDLSNFDIK